MARWDIDPDGVRGVVTRTAGVAEGLVEQADTYLERLRSAAEASGSAIVAKALADFAAFNQPFVEDLIARSTRVMTGAVTATSAYVRGDTEMADQAQAHATLSAHSARNAR